VILPVLYVGGLAVLLVLIFLDVLGNVSEDGKVPPQHARGSGSFSSPQLWPPWVVIFGLGYLSGALLSVEHQGMPGIHKRDYAFTVEARGLKWDCYHFVKEGKQGTLGFTKKDGRFCIGLMCAGRLDSEQARLKIEEDLN
jgi:hypothetical protein